MPTPLPVQDSSPPALAWAEFVSRRDGLVAQMEMATCDGCDGCGLRCMDGFTVSETEYDAAVAYVATCDPDFVAKVAAQPKTLALARCRGDGGDGDLLPVGAIAIKTTARSTRPAPRSAVCSGIPSGFRVRLRR